MDMSFNPHLSLVDAIEQLREAFLNFRSNSLEKEATRCKLKVLFCKPFSDQETCQKRPYTTNSTIFVSFCLRSGKKKDWCCNNGHNQFCVKFHCHEHATGPCLSSTHARL